MQLSKEVDDNTIISIIISLGNTIHQSHPDPRHHKRQFITCLTKIAVFIKHNCHCTTGDDAIMTVLKASAGLISMLSWG